MEDLARRLRRLVGRSARTVTAYVRPLPRDLGSAVDAGGASPQRIRRVAARARTRADQDALVAALLRLHSAGSASITEQRALRGLTGPAAPAAVTPWPATPPAATSPDRDNAAVLTIAERPGGGYEALVTTTHASDTRASDARAADTGVDLGADAWRPRWATLPAGLADQLVVCALARAALAHGITSVSVASPSGPPTPRLRRVVRALAATLTASRYAAAHATDSRPTDEDSR
jgi:hypothetical protein